MVHTYVISTVKCNLEKCYTVLSTQNAVFCFQSFRILANVYCNKVSYISVKIFCFFWCLASWLIIRIDSNPTPPFSLACGFFRQLFFLFLFCQQMLMAGFGLFVLLTAFRNTSKNVLMYPLQPPSLFRGEPYMEKWANHLYFIQKQSLEERRTRK